MKKNNVLHDDKIGLRAIEPEDIDILYTWENDTSIWKVSNTLAPFSKYILKQYLETSHQDLHTTKQLRLIIYLLNKPELLLGAIDLFDYDPFHRKAGIGILISKEEDRKKGYASSALNLLLEYVFNILCLHQVYCNISADNEKSLALFKKHGFDIIGKKKDWIFSGKNWIDEYMLQKINPLY